jgi:glycoprotein endo-alpha-1,2-mannosidase
MGAYDSLDERVIRAHLEMARYAGIDGLIANWPGPGTFEDQVMPALLDLAEDYGIAISVYRAAQPYAAHPAWLTDDGRPVFFFYGPELAAPSVWLEFRTSLEAELGPVVLVGNTFNMDYLGAFDAFHVYICMPEPDGTGCLQYYQPAIERLRLGPHAMEVDDAFAAAYAGELVPLDIKSLLVTVIPGYDDRKARYPDPGAVRDRRNGQFYAQFWDIVSQLSTESVLVTSFNEWHEGTEIEPSREYGFDYLQMTRQHVEQYKGVTLPTCQAGFSLTPRPFTVKPGGQGKGTRLLAAAGHTPALYVELEAAAVEGVSGLVLGGDFYTYLGEHDSTHASALIPGVFPGSPLEVTVTFTATQHSPLLGIQANAYDPCGTQYEVFDGRPQITELAAVYLPLVVAPPLVSGGLFEAESWSPAGQ